MDSIFGGFSADFVGFTACPRKKEDVMAHALNQINKIISWVPSRRAPRTAPVLRVSVGEGVKEKSHYRSSRSH